MEVALWLLLGAVVVGLVIASANDSRRGPRGQRAAKISRRILTMGVVGLFGLIAAFFLLLLLMRPIPV